MILCGMKIPANLVKRGAASEPARPARPRAASGGVIPVGPDGGVIPVGPDGGVIPARHGQRHDRGRFRRGRAR